jgi:hypothetical protein
VGPNTVAATNARAPNTNAFCRPALISACPFVDE